MYIGSAQIYSWRLDNRLWRFLCPIHQWGISSQLHVSIPEGTGTGCPKIARWILSDCHDGCHSHKFIFPLRYCSCHFASAQSGSKLHQSVGAKWGKCSDKVGNDILVESMQPKHEEKRTRKSYMLARGYVSHVCASFNKKGSLKFWKDSAALLVPCRIQIFRSGCLHFGGANISSCHQWTRVFISSIKPIAGARSCCARSSRPWRSCNDGILFPWKWCERKTSKTFWWISLWWSQIRFVCDMMWFLQVISIYDPSFVIWYYFDCWDWGLSFPWTLRDLAELMWLSGESCFWFVDRYHSDNSTR